MRNEITVWLLLVFALGVSIGLLKSASISGAVTAIGVPKATALSVLAAIIAIGVLILAGIKLRKK